MASPGPNGEPPPPRPQKVDDVKELYSLESLREDIYRFWGYRIDFKDSDAKQPKAVYERLLTELTQSLTEQRERLLDLVDGILSAVVEKTGTGRASARRSSSTSAPSRSTTTRRSTRTTSRTSCTSRPRRSSPPRKKSWAPS
jgi:hypothetical protein